MFPKQCFKCWFVSYLKIPNAFFSNNIDDMFNLVSPKNPYMWLNCNTNYLGSFSCLDFYFYGKTYSTQDSGTHLPLWSGLDGGSGSTASCSHSLPSPSSNEGRTLRFSWHQGFKQWIMKILGIYFFTSEN